MQTIIYPLTVKNVEIGVSECARKGNKSMSIIPFIIANSNITQTLLRENEKREREERERREEERKRKINK